MSAFMYGNILARANDVRHDVRGGSDKKEEIASRRNAAIIPIAVGRWPFLFMVATKGIPPSELQQCLFSYLVLQTFLAQLLLPSPGSCGNI